MAEDQIKVGDQVVIRGRVTEIGVEGPNTVRVAIERGGTTVQSIHTDIRLIEKAAE